MQSLHPTNVRVSRNKLKLPDDVFQSVEGEEIIEDYDEEAEKSWRLKHTESVRKLKQLEAKERHRQSQYETDVNKILDNYEMMEELAEELESLEIIDDETLSKVLRGEIKVPESKQRVAHNIEVRPEPDNPKISPAKHVPEINNNDLITQNNQEIVDLLKTYRCKIKEVLKNVKKDDERNVNLFLDLIELKDDIEDDIRKLNDDDDDDYSDTDERDSDDETTISMDTSATDDTKRKVRFSTSLEDVKLIESKSELYENEPPADTIQIQFQHSSAKFTPRESSDDTVAHPGEIFKRFHGQKLVAPAVRKSILKTRMNDVKMHETIQEEPVKKIFRSDIIGDVVEHRTDDVVHIMSKDDVPKKISKFKQMRLKS